MKRKRMTRFPRLSLLALSAKELCRFTEAMERAVNIVADMQDMLAELRRLKDQGTRRRRPAQASAAEANGTEPPSEARS